MKKHHSPRGKHPAFRLLAYAFTAVAILSAREVVRNPNGPASKKLGVFFNDTLMNSAKFGLGISLLHSDQNRANTGVPNGVKTLDDRKLTLFVAVPDRVNDQDEDMSLIGKGSKLLGQASHDAFVAAAKFDIYAK